MYRAAFIITLLLCGCGHGKEDKAKVKLVYVYRRDDAVRRCSSTVGQPKGAESRRERERREKDGRAKEKKKEEEREREEEERRGGRICTVGTSYNAQWRETGTWKGFK